MFKEICEKLGLTKSNIRLIGWILNTIKYPPLVLNDENEYDDFMPAVLSFVCAVVTLVGVNFFSGTHVWQIPFTWSVALLLFFFWGFRWLFYIIQQRIPVAIRDFWNKIPEGRKKKKREEETVTEETYGMVFSEPGDPLVEPPPPEANEEFDVIDLIRKIT